MSPADYGKKYWALVLDAFEGEQQRHATIFAPGRWLAVHGASCLDGSHVAVQHSEPNAKKGAKKP